MNNGTTYSINIWAVDTYVHAVSDTQITAATISSSAVTVTGYSLSETTSAIRGETYAMFGFNLTSSPGTADLYDVKV